MRRLPVPGDGPSRASRRILANTFYLVLADIANKLLSLGFFIIAARHLGVELFGVLSFAVAYVTTFGVLADLGLASYITREVARRPGDARVLVGQALFLRLLASLVVGALVAASAFVVGIPFAARWAVVICSILVVANGLFLLIAGVFQGFECNYFTAISRVVQTALLLLGAVLLLRLPPRVGPFSWLMSGAALASAGAALILMAVRVVRPSLRLAPHALWNMVRSALPMGISAVLVTAYYWNGSALLVSLSGERAAGVFAAPHRLVLAMAVLGTAFSSAMYPHMARVYSDASGQLTGVLGKALRYISLTAVPLAILGVVMAAEAVGVVYGGDYAESVPVLRVLALWGCGTFYNSLLSYYYYSADRARTATAQAAISLTVNVVANLLLIPRFGALGAAMALAAAELAGTVFLMSRIVGEWSRADRSALAIGVGKCLAAALIAGALGRVAALVSAPVALVSAVLVYLLLVVALGGVSRADLFMFGGLLARRG